MDLILNENGQEFVSWRQSRIEQQAGMDFDMRDGKKAAEKRLTGFTRSARVLGVALATAVDARTVRRARNRTADDESGGAGCLGHSVQFAAGLIALDSAPTGFAVAFTAAVRSVPAAQNRANTCDTKRKKRNDPVSVFYCLN